MIRSALHLVLAELILTQAKLLKLAGLTQEERSEFVEAVHFRDLAQLLDMFPSVRVCYSLPPPPLMLPQLSFQDLLELTPPLKFRYYSISSSPRATPGRVSITVVRNAYAPAGHPEMRHFGTASNYLDELQVGTKVPIFVQESYFRLPEDPKTPILMVGAGTGLAPFRGFLLDRSVQGATGPSPLVPSRSYLCLHFPAYSPPSGVSNGVPLNTLFFGCTRRDTDYIYRDELEAWQQSGLVSLHTAFSHEQPQLIFVQHRMREQADLVFASLQAGAHFYVCGSPPPAHNRHHFLLISRSLPGSLQMGAGIEEALKEICSARLGAEATTCYLRDLTEAGRMHWDLFA